MKTFAAKTDRQRATAEVVYRRRLESGKAVGRTWGDIYYAHRFNGEDHGYAAFCADQWEKRQRRKHAHEKI